MLLIQRSGYISEDGIFFFLSKNKEECMCEQRLGHWLLAQYPMLMRGYHCQS